MIRILNQTGKTLAILDNTINPVIKEKINGEYSFMCTTVVEELKTEFIHHDNYIEIDNQLFKICIYEDYRTEDNQLLYDIYAEQVGYELLDHKSNFLQPSKTAKQMLTTLLQGTNFNIGDVQQTEMKNITINEETNKKELLEYILELFNLEVEFDRYTISLKNTRGQKRGVEFRVGKNIRGISRRIDNTQKDQYGNPLISYNVNIVELDNLEEFKGLEQFEIGDTVRIFDEDLKIDVEVRIVEYTYNPIEKILSTVVLGNVIEDLSNHLVNLEKEAKRTNDRVTKVEFKITDEAIISTVSASEPFQDLQTQIMQTADDINLQSNRIDSVSTDIANVNIRADQIESTVSSHSATLSNHSSQISQNASQISLKVSSDDYNGNKIATLINMTDTTIKLQANKIELNGITEMNGLARVNGDLQLGSGTENGMLRLKNGSTISATNRGSLYIGMQLNTHTLDFDAYEINFNNAYITGLNVVAKFA